MAAKKTRKAKTKSAKTRGKADRKPARRTAAAKARKAPARPKPKKRVVKARAAAKPKRRPAPKRAAAKKRPVAKKKATKRVASVARAKKRAVKKVKRAVRAAAAPRSRKVAVKKKKALRPKKKAIAAARKPAPKKKALKLKKKAKARAVEPTPKPAAVKKAAVKKAAAAPPPPPKKSSPGKQAVPPPKKSSPGKGTAEGKASGKASGKRLLAEAPGKGARGARVAPVREPAPRIVTLPLPIMAPPKRPSIEERSAVIDTRLAAQTEEFRTRYTDSFDMSWIYHDSALEGVVYTFEELRSALAQPAQPVTDSSLQPTYDDIRRHKEAIEFVRDFGIKKRLPVTIDVVKKIYLILHPEEGDIKTVKYRKDIPQHRLYFHEYAPPDKIAYKVRQIVDWLNDPETRKTRNGVRIAARAHYDLLRVYPFATDSGKVSRLFMNLLLMRSGLPPAIIHSTERQRYYEALKGSATTVLQMVQEAVENALSSVEKHLDEVETKKRAFVS